MPASRRDLLKLGAGIAATSALPAVARPRWDAIVGTRPGDLPSFVEALTLAAAANGKPFRILLRRGVHVEKVNLAIPNVTIEGEGPGAILSHGTAAGHKHPDGRNWGTGRSATLTVEATDVTLRNLTIRNSFDYLDNLRTRAIDGAQAVALLIARGADRARVERCRLESWQDTLYVQAHARFGDCRIAGVVDFIFGGGAALFERCEIVTRLLPGAPGHGYIAAPSTHRNQRYGLCFLECRLTRERGVPDHSAWLGRPWRAGGNMALLGAAAFIDCWMDAHIRRDGWTWMGFRDPQGTTRRLEPEEARLFEFGSRGPGAGPATPKRRLLGAAETRVYTPAQILDPWKG